MQRETGGNLAETLENLGDILRKRPLRQCKHSRYPGRDRHQTNTAAGIKCHQVFPGCLPSKLAISSSRLSNGFFAAFASGCVSAFGSATRTLQFWSAYVDPGTGSLPVRVNDVPVAMSAASPMTAPPMTSPTPEKNFVRLVTVMSA